MDFVPIKWVDSCRDRIVHILRICICTYIKFISVTHHCISRVTWSQASVEHSYLACFGRVESKRKVIHRQTLSGKLSLLPPSSSLYSSAKKGKDGVFTANVAWYLKEKMKYFISNWNISSANLPDPNASNIIASTLDYHIFAPSTDCILDKCFGKELNFIYMLQSFFLKRWTYILCSHT